MHWIIVRTKLSKENQVANAILRQFACPTWVPVEIRSYRTAIGRRTRRREAKEIPLLPKCLFAAIPSAVHGDLQALRYFDRLERDLATGEPFLIPHNQVMAFRQAIEAENEIERQRAAKAAALPKKASKWVALTPATAAEVLKSMFGTTEIEEVA
jgi:hypothetical protein